jgi:hypothetical protein
MNIKQLTEELGKLLENDNLVNEIQQFLQEYALEDLEGWAWYKLPSTDNFNYIVLLDWQEGYDEDEVETFIKGGYGLNVSIRIDDGSYFKNDTPYPICDDSGECLTGCTLSDSDIEDNFKSMAEYMYDQYQEAIRCEKFSKKYID